MAEQIALINVRPLWARLPLALLAVAALWAAWYGVRWGIGNTMAETAPASYASDPTAAFESAEAAVRLAPRDPLAHLMLARLHQISFDPASVPLALRGYERAAALAPNDHLVWTEVGRARAALGDAGGGVAALRRAVELAPNYAQPRWHLGNALLRTGETEAAFAELRRAADADPALRPQVFNLAWQVYGPDMARVIDSVGKTALARAQLVVVLAGRARLDDALAVWASLSPDERRTHPSAGETLARALYGKGQYRRARQVISEAGAEGLAEGQLSNRGFESDIGQAGRGLFEWDVVQVAGAQIAVDARTAREGQRALRVVFNASGQVDFRNVSQVVAVEPGARYRLSFWVKTDGLKSAAMPAVLVSEPATPDAPLASSPPAPTGTADWQQVSFEFAAGPRTEAFVVRLARAGCPDGVCPIFGKIWYDDFHLERASGRAPAR
ncbi:MAG: carbohydrate binding domain-containing protein [Acidobacteria bacterium]|nr:carbohydrate binding domain-containing protein [Acidobacteriota bacterium]